MHTSVPITILFHAVDNDGDSNSHKSKVGDMHRRDLLKIFTFFLRLIYRLGEDVCSILPYELLFSHRSQIRAITSTLGWNYGIQDDWKCSLAK